MSDINGFAAADFPDDARTPVGDDLPGQETDAEAVFRERLEENEADSPAAASDDDTDADTVRP